MYKQLILVHNEHFLFLKYFLSWGRNVIHSFPQNNKENCYCEQFGI